jgi:hypothetical protein
VHIHGLPENLLVIPGGEVLASNAAEQACVNETIRNDALSIVETADLPQPFLLIQ